MLLKNGIRLLQITLFPHPWDILPANLSSEVTDMVCSLIPSTRIEDGSSGDT